MDNGLTYDQIYKALFSEEIEAYVPDGISVSHPVVGLWDGQPVDCFLLYSASLDGTRYTAPTARIIIHAEKKKLIDFKSAGEQPFSVYHGTDYFTDGAGAGEKEDAQAAEQRYQNAYMDIRRIAFKEHVAPSDKEAIVRYMKALKEAELFHLQPFLFELGQPFFQWAKTVLR